MYSKVFDNKKGKRIWINDTICEIHKRIYDLLVIGEYDKILPLLEKAYEYGIKMTKKLVEYKCSLPNWEENISREEVRRIRRLRIALNDVEAKNNIDSFAPRR